MRAQVICGDWQSDYPVYRHPARCTAIRKHCVPLTRPVLPGVDNSRVAPYPNPKDRIARPPRRRRRE